MKLYSILIFILSVFFIIFKGLNYGIDFKGVTLIELRTDKSVNASLIRAALKSMNLGDVNVKKFGKDGDYFTKPSKEDVFEKVYEMMNEVDPAKYPAIY